MVLVKTVPIIQEDKMIIQGVLQINVHHSKLLNTMEGAILAHQVIHPIQFKENASVMRILSNHAMISKLKSLMVAVCFVLSTKEHKTIIQTVDLIHVLQPKLFLKMERARLVRMELHQTL